MRCKEKALNDLIDGNPPSSFVDFYLKAQRQACNATKTWHRILLPTSRGSFSMSQLLPMTRSADTARTLTADEFITIQVDASE